MAVCCVAEDETMRRGSSARQTPAGLARLSVASAYVTRLPTGRYDDARRLATDNQWRAVTRISCGDSSGLLLPATDYPHQHHPHH